MHLFPKVNRAQMPQQKCHVSMLDRAHGYMQRVGTGSVITRIVWAPGKLDETGTQAKWSWKAEKFQRKNSESKVLQYFGNLAAPFVFAEVMKVMNHTGLWDAELTWYSPNVTRWICLYGLEPGFRNHHFRPTWHCWIIKVLATWTKFL